ncbi:prepilin-type N-terminal cleavage/methylation domain-containing protein [Leptolyngbya sp. 15MV]|nr:prepilin-type N-terminal cleavage/methylation domain-containing protein [Leptolyngbya sp. 15MV]
MNAPPEPRRVFRSATPPASWAQRRAFSLMELLVVMAIVAILMAITIPAIASARESAPPPPPPGRPGPIPPPPRVPSCRHSQTLAVDHSTPRGGPVNHSAARLCTRWLMPGRPRSLASRPQLMRAPS